MILSGQQMKRNTAPAVSAAGAALSKTRGERLFSCLPCVRGGVARSETEG